MLEAGHVAVGGLTIAYDRAGTGSALLLLHGIGGTPWRQQFEAFSRDYTVIAWHAPGYGRSSDPDAEWTMSEYAHALAGLLDELGIGSAHVLGQSWGGVLAQELYRQRAYLFRSLTLSDTTLGGAAARDDDAERLAVRLRAAETLTVAEFARIRTPQLLAPNPSPEVAHEVEAGIAKMVHLAGFRNAAIALARSDTRDVLPRVSAPTLVIYGEFDRVILPAVGTRLIDELPNAQLVGIPGAGHLACVEQPERYNAVLREFLHGVSAV